MLAKDIASARKKEHEMEKEARILVDRLYEEVGCEKSDISALDLLRLVWSNPEIEKARKRSQRTRSADPTSRERDCSRHSFPKS